MPKNLAGVHAISSNLSALNGGIGTSSDTAAFNLSPLDGGIERGGLGTTLGVLTASTPT